MTDIYTPTGAPATSSQGLSATMRAEFTAIQAALSSFYTTSSNWTPTDISGGGLTFTTAGCKYAKVGSVVILLGQIIWPATADTNLATIGGFPLAPLSATYGGMSVGFTNLGAIPMLLVGGGGMAVYKASTGGLYTNAEMSGKSIIFSGTYLT